ncbi:DUF6786 family protein [Thalassotalea sp. PLHSN55]|uniref:DUF6786 family protein n=1 Tax=Thalassotalea sp. PLHSN55 TaxID=3435888 RepID=UPI003F839DB0
MKKFNTNTRKSNNKRLSKIPCKGSITLLITLLLPFAATSSTFEQDKAFIEKYDQPILLSSANRQHQLLISAKHQGRVITSTANGEHGLSNGWVNYDALSAGKGNVGGEDRFWLAPIGSKYSVFYPVGDSFASNLWRVPEAVSETPFTLISKNAHSAHLYQKLHVQNMQGTEFIVGVDRNISLYSKRHLNTLLKIKLPENVKYIGFGSNNRLTNLGKDWRADTGLLSIWILGMFQGTDNSWAIAPLNQEVSQKGQIHTYLNTINNDYLKQHDEAVYFKVDGKFRAKLGVPKTITKDRIASYSPELNRLTVVLFSFTNQPNYPIALESDVPDGTLGDVSNFYNHQGPSADKEFYELETAAAMEPLKHGDFIEHQHHTFHFFGNSNQLDNIAQQVLGLSLQKIQTWSDK